MYTSKTESTTTAITLFDHSSGCHCWLSWVLTRIERYGYTLDLIGTDAKKIFDMKGSVSASRPRSAAVGKLYHVSWAVLLALKIPWNGLWC